jgi:hypothetical protein
MILHGKKKIKTEWYEITWREAADLLAIEIPPDVREKMKGEVVEYVDWLIADGIFNYARKVIGVLSDIPDRQTIRPEDCLYNYMIFHVRLIADLLSATPMTYTPRNIEKVSFGGKVYRMPASLRIGEGTLPMSAETADNFVEASNILREFGKLKEKGVQHLNYFVAVYLREEGEGYDEKRIAERAELFKDMTMDIYWEVFFCIHRLLARHINDTLESLTGGRGLKRVIWALKFGSLRWLNPVFWAHWIRFALLRFGNYLKRLTI